MRTLRLVAGAIGYAATVLFVAMAGDAVLQALAGGAGALAGEVVAALGTAVLAASSVLGDVGSATALLPPLAFLAIVVVLVEMVWPLTNEHAGDDATEEVRRSATVVRLPRRDARPRRHRAA